MTVIAFNMEIMNRTKNGNYSGKNRMHGLGDHSVIGHPIVRTLELVSKSKFSKTWLKHGRTHGEGGHGVEPPYCPFDIFFV